MKHQVFFCLVTISFVSYSMEPVELSLLPVKKQERANAREVALFYSEFVNYMHVRYPDLMIPELYQPDLEKIRKSRLTDEQKQHALNNINTLYIWDYFFGVKQNEGPKKKQRMG